MRKRIYLISYNFIPSARADGINRGYLCQALVKNDWDISVITTSNSKRLLMTYQEDETLWSILPSAIKVYRISDFDRLGLGEFLYLTRFFSCPHQYWEKAVIQKVSSILVEPGILYAIVPPISNALVGLAAKRRYSFPLVLDFRDEYLNVEMIHRFPIEWKRFHRLESEVIQAADLIITATEGIQSTLIGRYQLSKQLVHVIYNGYGETTSGFGKTPRNDTFRIIYMGTISRFQKPEILCHAYQKLVEADRVWQKKVAVEFYGPENYYVKRFLKRALIPGTSFKGYLPFLQMLGKLNEADVAFTSIAHNDLSYMLPSRIFYYMSLEKPILAAATEGILKNFIEHHCIGIWSHFKDVEGLAKNISELYTNRERLAQFQQNIRLIKREFSMEVQARKLSLLMEKLI